MISRRADFRGRRPATSTHRRWPRTRRAAGFAPARPCAACWARVLRPSAYRRCGVVGCRPRPARSRGVGGSPFRAAVTTTTGLHPRAPSSRGAGVSCAGGGRTVPGVVSTRRQSGRYARPSSGPGRARRPSSTQHGRAPACARRRARPNLRWRTPDREAIRRSSAAAAPRGDGAAPTRPLLRTPRWPREIVLVALWWSTGSCAIRRRWADAARPVLGQDTAIRAPCSLRVMPRSSVGRLELAREAARVGGGAEVCPSSSACVRARALPARRTPPRVPRTARVLADRPNPANRHKLAPTRTQEAVALGEAGSPRAERPPPRCPCSRSRRSRRRPLPRRDRGRRPRRDPRAPAPRTIRRPGHRADLRRRSAPRMQGSWRCPCSRRA
jgi:hypothetical protein